MQNKLHELTEKIYREGVSKGKKEAEVIISEARAEAEKIIGQAGKEAEEIIARARKDTDELRKNTESELKISFRHAINTLKQEAEKIIAGKIVDEPVSELFADNRLIARLIETIAGKWSPGENESGIEVYIPEEMKNELEDYFTKAARKTLASGITIKPVKSMDKGFEIKPSGKDYKINVTEKDFNSFLKEFLRPRLVDLLF
jgi:V/A-type H+/Na+-transporting ATPase subunit E